MDVIVQSVAESTLPLPVVEGIVGAVGGVSDGGECL
jgi:hypothetical protein